MPPTTEQQGRLIIITRLMVQVPPIEARTIAAPITPIIAVAMGTPTTTPELPMAPAVDQLPGAMAVEAPLAGVVARPRGVTVAEAPRVIEVGQSPGAVAR